jgi:hypothetical protein
MLTLQRLFVFAVAEVFAHLTPRRSDIWLLIFWLWLTSAAACSAAAAAAAAAGHSSAACCAVLPNGW